MDARRPSIRVPVVLALALALVGLARVPALAAARPNLTVTKVTAPAKATGGKAAAVSAVVKNAGAGAAAASKTAWWLSTDTTQSSDDVVVPVKGGATAPLKPHASATSKAKVTLPKDTTPGTYYLIACADGGSKVAESSKSDNCRSSGVVHVVSPQTSTALIEQDVASGAISREEGLEYRLFADFKDKRLPAQYAGTPDGLGEDDAAQEAEDGWDSLSTDAQNVIRPFLIPPYYQGSYASPDPNARTMRHTSDRRDGSGGMPWCVGYTAFAKDWAYKDTSDGAFRIWYQTGVSTTKDDKDHAEHYAAILPKILLQLEGLMNLRPRPDDGGLCDGGSSAVDIAITNVADAVTKTNGYCGQDGNSTRIMFPNSLKAMTWKGFDPYLAHEVMHVLQFASPMHDDCDNYGWLREATAQWVQDWMTDAPYGPKLLKPDDTEWDAASKYLPVTEEQLDSNDQPAKHGYGDYLLPFYVTRKANSARFISDIWANVPGEDAVHAVNTALDGGFDKVWRQFTFANLNVKPMADYFTWDGLQDSTSVDDTVDLLAGPDHKDTRTVDVAHLASRTFVYKVKTGVTEVDVTNDQAGNTHDAVMAMLKYTDGTAQKLDLSDTGTSKLCVFENGKVLESVTLVYSNSDMTAPTTFHPVVEGKAVCGCQQVPTASRASAGSMPAASAKDADDGLCNANLTWDVTDSTTNDDNTGSGYEHETGAAVLKLKPDPKHAGNYLLDGKSKYQVDDNRQSSGQGQDNCAYTNYSDDQGTGTLANQDKQLQAFVSSGNLIVFPFTMKTTLTSDNTDCAGTVHHSDPDVLTPPNCPDAGPPNAPDPYYTFSKSGTKGTYTFSCTSSYHYRSNGDGITHDYKVTVSGTITVPKTTSGSG